ncbi:alanine:cation symporter family protein [Clostridium novyi]|uniref:alanine:cation symporter family protein n=1 Tax=Clostridium novyi TaxID=1542 RepID=UPI000AAFA9EF|nr:alanine:cation symporter family protein [Clostridium novyi]
MKSALSISLSSKIGTGAIIGVLAAMWKTSNNGVGGESIVLWVFIGMFLLVPLTYSEVLFSQITRMNPRKFIDEYVGKKGRSYICYLFSNIIFLWICGISNDRNTKCYKYIF